jgi:hypothetical protein
MWRRLEKRAGQGGGEEGKEDGGEGGVEVLHVPRLVTLRRA